MPSCTGLLLIPTNFHSKPALTGDEVCVSVLLPGVSSLSLVTTLIKERKTMAVTVRKVERVRMREDMRMGGHHRRDTEVIQECLRASLRPSFARGGGSAIDCMMVQFSA